jgi:DNA-binding IclR family transcriptional regulator
MAAEGKGIQSIEIGFGILEVLARSVVPMTLSAIAAEVGMSASKAHFYLTSFARLAVVTQSVAGGPYTLGPAAVRIGVAALAQIDILQLAREALFELRDATGESAFLSVWGNLGPTIVHRVQGLRWTPLEIRVGLVLSALSATGRAFLSCFPDQVVEELLADTLSKATPHEPWFGMPPTHAREMLDEVKQDGVARGSASVAPGSGFRGLAAPLVDHEGNVLAVFTINGDSTLLDVSTSGRNVTALLATTQRLSQRIGTRISNTRGKSSR